MQRALFVHGGALGDFVLALRIVQSILENGYGPVDVLARGGHLSLLSLINGAGMGLDLDRGGFHHFFATSTKIPRDQLDMLRGYSLVVSMLPATELSFELSRLGTPYVEIDPVARADLKAHITNQWCNELPRHWVIPDFAQPLLVIDDAMRSRGRGMLERTGANGKVVILHPGSGGRQKCYPQGHFVDLAERLAGDSLSPAFLLGEVEHEIMSPVEIETIRAHHSILDNLSLSELAAVLSVADCFVGNDSGVSHLAAAIGTSTITIFGPTDPRIWCPLGPRVTLTPSTNDGLGVMQWPEPEAIFQFVQRCVRGN